MNANELADRLKTATNNLIGKEYELGGRAINLYTFSATMLRQQQAEIEALKETLQEVVRISDRNHDAWNKAKELLK